MKLMLTLEAFHDHGTQAFHDYGTQTFHATPRLKDGAFFVNGWEGGGITGNFSDSDQAFFASVFDANAARALNKLNRLTLASAFVSLKRGRPVELFALPYSNGVHVYSLLEAIEE